MANEALITSAERWELLADAAEDTARYNRERGLDLSAPGQSVGDYQAKTFRDCAKAIRLEAETGHVHCSICLGKHPNHLHMHVG